MSDYDDARLAGERGEPFKPGMDRSGHVAGQNQRHDDFVKNFGPKPVHVDVPWTRDPSPAPAPTPPVELWSSLKNGAVGGGVTGLLLSWLATSQALDGQALVTWAAGGAGIGASLGLAWWLMHQVFKLLAALLPWCVGLAVLAYFVPEVRVGLIGLWQRFMP